MEKRNKNDELNLAEWLSNIVCFLIMLGSFIFLYIDLMNYSSEDIRFSSWQIPLIIFLLGVFAIFYLSLFAEKKNGYILLTTIIFTILIITVPYQNFGDWKILRSMALCSDYENCK